MTSPFADIMRAVVEGTPGAVGAAFAADDGETVDSFAAPGADTDEWALLTAHYGVVLKFVQSAFHVFHYGDAQLVMMSHERLDVLVRTVADGYYALLAVEGPTPLGLALRQLETAAVDLREEMG